MVDPIVIDVNDDSFQISVKTMPSWLVGAEAGLTTVELSVEGERVVVLTAPAAVELAQMLREISRAIEFQAKTDWPLTLEHLEG